MPFGEGSLTLRRIGRQLSHLCAGLLCGVFTLSLLGLCWYLLLLGGIHTLITIAKMSFHLFDLTVVLAAIAIIAVVGIVIVERPTFHAPPHICHY
eukprot:SAG25_NODE_5094_length_703_cov_1.023179_1_plen_94_part_01